jgi:hypothetical protein
MAATVAVITGVGMIRLLSPPITIGEQPESALLHQLRPSVITKPTMT